MTWSTVFWTIASLTIISLAYFASLVFILGMLWKFYRYLVTPMPWPGVTTPAPETEGGALLRLLGDAAIFSSLFKADKALWAGSWIFHFSLAAILFRHLRYATYPVPALVLSMETVALVFGYIFGLAALFLFWRRLAQPRNLYVSNLPDFLALGILGAIAATGIMVSYWTHVNLVDVKAFTLGLLTLQPVAPPQHPLFLIHFGLVCLLMIYFPFSKLLHAGGIFFSPSLNQPYQIQKAGKRYVNPWDAPNR